MTTFPTRTQTGSYVAQMKRVDWNDIELALAAAIVRERAGTPVADGYPRNVGYSGTSVSSNGVGNPTLEAAVQRANGDTPTDLHRTLTLASINDMRSLVDTLARLQTNLGKIRRLVVADADQVPPCEPCAAARVQHPSMHWGTVGGRLVEPVHLCKDVYAFVRRHTRLPTAEEVRAHDETGRWRVRVAPQR